MVSDHARTRGFFTLATQHHIALLFYSPGHVPARATWAVASQIDILPTVLALLQLKTRHASWGRDLMTLPDNEGFAVSMAGSETRWLTRKYLLNDSLTDARPMLFDLTADADCRRNAWDKYPTVGEDLKTKLRSYLSLSQTLLNQNRVFPGP
jgi:arylsulfatase A-like enzyme